MNNDIRSIYQVDTNLFTDKDEKIMMLSPKNINVGLPIHMRRSSKNSVSYTDQNNNNSRSQSRKSQRNQNIQDQLHLQQIESNQSQIPQSQFNSNLQIRQSISSKFIRISASQFFKKQQNTPQSREIQSDSKNAYFLSNTSQPVKLSKYLMMTSRNGSFTQNQFQQMNNGTKDQNLNTNNIKRQSTESLPIGILPMSQQYKRFQEPYFSSMKASSYKNNNTSIPHLTTQNSNNNTTNNNNILISQKNSQGNLLQKYFSNQPSINPLSRLQSINTKENNTLSYYDHDDISTQFGNQSIEANLRNQSPSQQKLTIITQKIYSKPSYNYSSPKAGTTNTTENTYYSKVSFPVSPKQNFFITENSSENLQNSTNDLYNNQDNIDSEINDKSYLQNSKYEASKSPLKTEYNDQALNKQTSFQNKLNFSKQRISAYYNTPLKFSSDKNRLSLQEQFQTGQQIVIRRLDSQVDDYQQQKENEKESQKSCTEDDQENSVQDFQNSDKNSDYSLPFNKDSLLQNAKDKVYYERIMTPMSTKSEIQKERQQEQKPKLKFYQKLKQIEKIEQENEFDKVKIRNVDLEAVIIKNQLKNNVLPLNLNRYYKENNIPQMIQKNMKIKKTELTTNNNINESNNCIENQINGGTPTLQEQQQQQQQQQINSPLTIDRMKSTETGVSQKPLEGQISQKRIGGVNYQGLQDEEKIKEMEEFLESDKYNETFYANNLKMGKPYIDIITNILKQKKARRSLKQVFVKNNRINNDSLAKIVQNLPLSTKQLDLSCNQINHIGSKYVIELLQDNAFHNLEYLNVSKNMIGDIGAIKIFEAVVSNNFLKILDVSHNKITNICNKFITKLLLSNQYLDELYLGHNTLMNESLKAICEGLVGNSNLKVLDLQNNSLGGSDNPQKFYGKKLIRICNDKNQNMKHLDLSYNRFLKNEALEIAKELQDNFYLYGLHFEGNPCNFIINERGFLVENKKSFEEQGRGMFQRNIRINDFQNVSEIYKEYYYKTVNESDSQLLSTHRQGKAKMTAKRDDANACKSGEVCWICDGYKEVKFTFKLNYKIHREPVYIHLSFEGYEPFRMEQDPHESTKFFIYRMCPPDKQITYFFTNPFINQVSILPYNQIRSESNPMNLLSNRNKRSSIQANQILNQKFEEAYNSAISKTLIVDYTDITNYVIPLPYLMNVYKQPVSNKNDKQFPFQLDSSKNMDLKTNEMLESAEELIQQINQFGERKKEEYKVHINKDEFDKNHQGELIYMYKKKLSNVLNDNYDPIIRSIIRQIQKPYLEQAESVKGWKKNGWDIRKSVFAEYKGDDNLFLKNCFEFDWSQSKLNKMVRTEDDKEDLKQVLYDIYPYLKNTYKQLACQNMYGDFFAVSSFLFSDFISQTKIVDGKLIKSSDVEFNFIATNAQKEKHPRNPDRALIRYQFMEVLVRLAFDKYVKNKTYSGFSEAFKQILNEEDLLKVLMASNDPQKWRENRLWTPQCDTLIKSKMDYFKRLYERWAGSRNKEKRLFQSVKVMCCQEFKDFISSYAVFADLNNEKELNQFFNDSIMTQVDELNKDRHMQMQLIEFIEAIGRISDKMSPVPYGEDKDAYSKEELIQLPLHMKIESIISQIEGNKQSLSQPKNSSRGSLLYIQQREASMPKINSQNVLDQKSIAEIKDVENQMPSSTQIKLGFKGFMLAKSLKKRLIDNKKNSIQPHKKSLNTNKQSLENIEENMFQ